MWHNRGRGASDGISLLSIMVFLSTQPAFNCILNKIGSFVFALGQQLSCEKQKACPYPSDAVPRWLQTTERFPLIEDGHARRGGDQAQAFDTCMNRVQLLM